MTIRAMIINLDKAKNRWDFQQQQLAQLSIPYQRLRATQTDELTDSEYEKWANSWQRKLRATEVACFLSHYRAWQHVLETNSTWLILEDDALLSKNTSVFINEIQQMTVLPFEHLTLETRGRKKLFSTEPISYVKNINLHTLLLDKTGAAAYILTSQGAKKLIERVNRQGAGLADALLCERPNKLKSLQVLPALAIQMDMMEHYQVDIPALQQASTSNISTTFHSKPKANSLINNITFKYRRLNAQIKMGITQLKYKKESYKEVMFDSEGISYIFKQENEI